MFRKSLESEDDSEFTGRLRIDLTVEHVYQGGAGQYRVYVQKDSWSVGKLAYVAGIELTLEHV